MDNTTGSRLTRAFLKDAEKAGRVVNIAEDIPKSFVVCIDGGKVTVICPSWPLQRCFGAAKPCV
jgi:hypothetical protein